MRYVIATLIGLVVSILLHVNSESIANQFGLLTDVPLDGPTEIVLGRGAEMTIDSSPTLLGYARFGLSIAIGAYFGAAFYRRTINPWTKPKERITAKAWLVYLPILLVYSIIFQVIFGPSTTGLTSNIEFGLPLYTGWRFWKWWKVSCDSLSGTKY